MDDELPESIVSRIVHQLNYGRITPAKAIMSLNTTVAQERAKAVKPYIYELQVLAAATEGKGFKDVALFIHNRLRELQSQESAEARKGGEE